eukprot:8773525-Pyramimonas_sp.AAC.1
MRERMKGGTSPRTHQTITAACECPLYKRPVVNCSEPKKVKGQGQRSRKLEKTERQNALRVCACSVTRWCT